MGKVWRMRPSGLNQTPISEFMDLEAEIGCVSLDQTGMCMNMCIDAYIDMWIDMWIDM